MVLEIFSFFGPSKSRLRATLNGIDNLILTMF